MNAPWGALGVVPLVFACTGVADDRTERDESVGHYDVAGVKVDVDEGLAVVREANGEHVMLWSSAPLWTATVQGNFTDTYEVEVHNLVPGSALTATGPNDEALAVTLIDEPRSTVRRFSVAARGDRVELALVPPQSSKSGSFQFAVLSDIQSAVTEVRKILLRISDEPEVDFVLSVGDLTDLGTKDQLEFFESKLRMLKVPFYTTLGNHELFFSDKPPFQDLFGRANFHFHYRGVAFSFVDSASATLSPLAHHWLMEWLEHDRSRTHVFATHMPLVDPFGVRGGGFASRIEAHQLVAKLAEGRVDAAFYGHIHSFCAFSTAGIPSYISGGGGGRPELLDGVGRHYLMVKIDDNGLKDVRKIEVD